jgi:acyl-homoserine-lactone acylase
MNRSLKRIAATVLVIAGTTMATRPSAAGNTEILWDRYGVPHIFATNRESMFYAEGWAQMEAQANLLLELYGESRGRAAEYWVPRTLRLIAGFN